MSYLEGLYVDVGYPRDKIQYPKTPEFLYVAWTQMLIPDRFREFVEMRYNNSAKIPVAISWYKKCKEDEDWVNWFADQAGLPRPLHFFHNDKSLNPVVEKKKTKKPRKNGTRIQPSDYSGRNSGGTSDEERLCVLYAGLV